MYAPIVLEGGGEKGESLLCFMPKEPSLAACTGLNHMGALNSCILMDLSPGAVEPQHFSQPQYTNKRIRPYTSQTERVQWGKGPFGRGSPDPFPKKS